MRVTWGPGLVGSIEAWDQWPVLYEDILEAQPIVADDNRIARAERVGCRDLLVGGEAEEGAVEGAQVGHVDALCVPPEHRVLAGDVAVTQRQAARGPAAKPQAGEFAAVCSACESYRSAKGGAVDADEPHASIITQRLTPGKPRDLRTPSWGWASGWLGVDWSG